MTFDLVIRGGTVVDGTGSTARTADVAIAEGEIAEVGRVDGRGLREIQADGALVTPGFVDVHTHYDGQVTWDDRITPSSDHGVTTAVMGNCGVGFAPVRPGDRDRLVELMEGVEDLPGAVLHEGLPWTWESIEDYLETLATRRFDIDCAVQVCHAPLRVYVMGERGAAREPATDAEIAEMGDLAARAIRAGALGFSTSRTINHRAVTGEPTPTLAAARRELVGIATAIGATNTGVLQVVSDLTDFDDEMDTFYEMMRCSGRPLSLSVAQTSPGDDYRRTLSAIEAANQEGLHMRGQVAARAVGVLIAFEGSVNPWAASPTFQSAPDLTAPDVKRRILEETAQAEPSLPYDRVFELGNPVDYEPAATSSIAARAANEGRSPQDLLYDVMLEGPAYLPALNYFDGNLDAVAEMLAHPYTIPGLGDGGAHVGAICDASFPTTLLTHWARDRRHGRRFGVEWIVALQSRETAAAVGLYDRGLVAPRMKADLNVIDFDQLVALPPTIVADLPAGGRRVQQHASGYLHTIVSGVEISANGQPTGERPGRLARRYGDQSNL